MDTQQLDVFFDTLRKGLVPLIRAIGEKPQIDDSFLHLEYPVEQQKAFADYLMEVMGLDRGHCGLGETEHPFTLEFNNKDVRITTQLRPAQCGLLDVLRSPRGRPCPV